MSSIDLERSMQSLETGRSLGLYTGVIIHVGRNSGGAEVTYSSGDNSGYVLEFDNPFGTQEMADSILAGLKLRGVQYQPFKSGKAPVDPATEIGDSISFNGLSSIAMSIEKNHSSMMAADVEAPFDEDVDHAFKYEAKIVREFKRESAYTRSRITQTEESIALEVVRATGREEELSSLIEINTTEINAKVSKTGGSPSSFGWTLTDNSWTLYSNGNTVLSVNSSGLSVTGNGTFSGTITATAGTIGGVTISNGVLSGIRDANIASGGISGGGGGGAGSIAAGTLSGGSGGDIAGSTITTSNTVSGINTNLGYGADYGLAISSSGTTHTIKAKILNNTSNYMTFYGHNCSLQTIVINNTTYYLIGYHA